MAIVKRPNRSQTDIASEEGCRIVYYRRRTTFDQAERKIPILVGLIHISLYVWMRPPNAKGISRSAWIHFMVSSALEQEQP